MISLELRCQNLQQIIIKLSWRDNKGDETFPLPEADPGSILGIDYVPQSIARVIPEHRASIKL